MRVPGRKRSAASPVDPDRAGAPVVEVSATLDLPTAGTGSAPPPAPGAVSPEPVVQDRPLLDRATVEEVEALTDAVATAVLAVPAVAGLHAGPFGTVATYLPGRRVVGIQLRADALEVHVSVITGADILATAAAVHAAAEAVLAAPVHVVVEDLVAPPA